MGVAAAKAFQAGKRVERTQADAQRAGRDKAKVTGRAGGLGGRANE